MKLIDRVITKVLEDAEDRRSAAGCNGEFHDRGASQLEDQVKFFKYGLSNAFPPEWDHYIKEAEKESDPDYALYKKLKSKFER